MAWKIKSMMWGKNSGAYVRWEDKWRKSLWCFELGNHRDDKWMGSKDF